MLFVAITTVAVLSGCGPSKTVSPGSSQPIATVTIAAPERSMVQETLDYTGRIEASQRVEVRSRLSGYLQAIKFRDGQQVKAGDPLFVIDQRPFAVARDRAQAIMAQAIARQKLATTQLTRVTRLHQSGASSADELDRTRGEFEGAQAAVLLSQAELRSVELELSFATIRSPITGTVSDHRVDIGNYVVGGTAQGGLLTTIVAQSPVRAMVDLSEADFQRLRRQKKFPDRAQLRLDGTADTQISTIDFIDNEISARSGTVRLRASIANVDKTIKPGSFAHVRVPVGAPEEKFLVPDSAIQSDQTKKLVLVVDANGKVAPKRVDLGGLFNGKRVVLSGLSANDKVIVSGAQRVRPGDSVKLSTPAAGA
ncbi:MAG: efflux RND transporter periplasmic adaptor subunit [Undibacterium sp.]|nr:efflux RND transporter periplasmic adaptor subunit [Undibacterium sp.]MDO8651313.1 efflux RND transporter periplasmic adaptor subunit [Undibacterium sp.]